MVSVSAVIPSMGRDSLLAAVKSVRAQHGAAVEVVVAFDLDRPPLLCSELRAGIDVVTTTGGSKGGSAARNRGTEAASGTFVAYLDDDDEWLPDKCEQQLAVAGAMAADGARPVVLGAVLQRRAGFTRLAGPSPSTIIAGGQAPEDYLFRRRRVRVDRPLLPTSSLLTTRSFALERPWDESLRRHQDWDWLVKAYRHEQVAIKQIESPTIVYTVGSANSISASPDWRASLEWGRRWKDDWAGQTYADFICAQVLRYAIQSRDVASVRAIVAELRGKPIPSPSCVLAAATAFVPRQLLERVALGS